jgi:hypothetical protein
LVEYVADFLHLGCEVEAELLVSVDELFVIGVYFLDDVAFLQCSFDAVLRHDTHIRAQDDQLIELLAGGRGQLIEVAKQVQQSTKFLR